MCTVSAYGAYAHHKNIKYLFGLFEYIHILPFAAICLHKWFTLTFTIELEYKPLDIRVCMNFIKLRTMKGMILMCKL